MNIGEEEEEIEVTPISVPATPEPAPVQEPAPAEPVKEPAPA